MSEEDWGYLESLMDGFGTLLSDISYGRRDKAWWDKFYEYSDLIKKQIKKVQPSEGSIKKTREPDWWVYENWTVRPDRARVHRGTCSRCNHGKGIHKDVSGRRSRWHGPFPSSTKAMAEARKLGRADTDFCAWCRP